MAARNLAARADMEGDVLRQRRDLYAVSIGLLLFYLAHGSLGNQSTISGILPLTFGNPCVFLWAAWIAFFYFLLRYRLLAPTAFARWGEEAMWQGGNTATARAIAARLINRPENAENELKQKETVLAKAGPVPLLIFYQWRFKPSLKGIRTDAASQDFRAFNTTRDLSGKLSPRDHLKLWGAAIFGFVVATWRERSFTDYVLPYLVAFVTVAVALTQWMLGRSHLCLPW